MNTLKVVKNHVYIKLEAAQVRCLSLLTTFEMNDCTIPAYYLVNMRSAIENRDYDLTI